MSLLLMAAIGVAVGLLLGLTGVGSGSVLTPVLILFCGFAPAKAVGTSLAFAFVTKILASASFYRRGFVDFSILRKLAPGAAAGLATAFVLLKVLGYRSPETENIFLQRSIGAALLLVFVLMCTHFLPGAAGETIARHRLRFAERHELPLTLATGYIVGLSVSLTSVGGGAALVPLLYLLYHPESGRLVGTSLFFSTALSAAAGLLHATGGHIDPLALAALLLGSLPAIWLASHMHGRIPRILSEAVIAVVMLLLGVRLAFL
jgi:uncharacterized membrane protein YfcA